MARTIQTTVYRFHELSEDAKQKAINKYRKGQEFSFIYDDAHESVKQFHEIFGTQEGICSWLDPRTSMTNEDILLLSGIRLQTYIWNNYGSRLWKRKYLNNGGLSDQPKQYHKMRKQSQIKVNCPNKDKWSSSYYSNIQTNNCCVLTGVCYDDDLLQPIYDFLKTPQKDNSVTFNDLIYDCFYSLSNSLRSEEEAMQTDEYIIDEIEANEYEFTEEGRTI